MSDAPSSNVKGSDRVVFKATNTALWGTGRARKMSWISSNKPVVDYKGYYGTENSFPLKASLCVSHGVPHNS